MKMSKILSLPLGTQYDKAPASSHLDTFIKKFKEIRLNALRLDPQAFSANLATEETKDYSSWEDRLKNPLARTFIALEQYESNLKITHEAEKEEQSNDLEVLKHSKWIGLTLLLGPRSFASEIPLYLYSAETFFAAHCKNLSSFDDGIKWQLADNDETKSTTVVYVMNSVFVDPGYRGQGIAKKLVRAALDQIAKEQILEVDGQPSTGKRVCLVHVKVNNKAAKSVYETVGFETLTERPVARGDEMVAIMKCIV